MTSGILQNSLVIISTAQTQHLEKFLSERAILDTDEKIKKMRQKWLEVQPSWETCKEYVMGGDAALLYYGKNKIRFIRTYHQKKGVRSLVEEVCKKYFVKKYFNKTSDNTLSSEDYDDFICGFEEAANVIADGNHEDIDSRVQDIEGTKKDDTGVKKKKKKRRKKKKKAVAVQQEAAAPSSEKVPVSPKEKKVEDIQGEKRAAKERKAQAKREKKADFFINNFQQKIARFQANREAPQAKEIFTALEGEIEGADQKYQKAEEYLQKAKEEGNVQNIPKLTAIKDTARRVFDTLSKNFEPIKDAFTPPQVSVEESVPSLPVSGKESVPSPNISEKEQGILKQIKNIQERLGIPFEEALHVLQLRLGEERIKTNHFIHRLQKDIRNRESP
ncbi:MAG: hypothetical protein SP4CHLAM5_03940 [Chlamydiia bacterium]|nr:hypothetical protein [Chlamydiia bacterium]MCH9618267.1 hypothetical protein [Chlamydiia bacterium]MCH9624765.1 hypothetical protein [Chlamydiia bacterium]